MSIGQRTSNDWRKYGIRSINNPINHNHAEQNQPEVLYIELSGVCCRSILLLLARLDFAYSLNWGLHLT